MELRGYSKADVDHQLVPLSTVAWASVLGSFPLIAADLADEVASHAGIRRSFVHERAAGNPVDLFLAAMAWGFGPTAYGPARVAKMMAGPQAGGPHHATEGPVGRCRRRSTKTTISDPETRAVDLIKRALRSAGVRFEWGRGSRLIGPADLGVPDTLAFGVLGTSRQLAFVALAEVGRTVLSWPRFVETVAVSA